jgi:hypothetical protein
VYLNVTKNKTKNNKANNNNKTALKMPMLVSIVLWHAQTVMSTSCNGSSIYYWNQQNVQPVSMSMSVVRLCVRHRSASFPNSCVIVTSLVSAEGHNIPPQLETKLQYHVYQAMAIK